MSELWADVPGYEGRYQVSSDGRVKSFAHDKINGRLMKPQLFSNGYFFVVFGAGGAVHLVHRLVAKVFIPGDHSLQVNHIDGLRANNGVENLEWLSCSENHKHSYRELVRKPHALCRPVVLKKLKEELAFNSIKDAVRHLNSDVGTLSKCLKHGYRCRGYEVHDAL